MNISWNWTQFIVFWIYKLSSLDAWQQVTKCTSQKQHHEFYQNQ